MNDKILEQKLRELPVRELPEVWRVEILAQARREARSVSQNYQLWPTLFIYLRHLWLQNPVTTSAMSMLWLLIFVFKAVTPVDPDEQMLLVHFDPHRPIYLVSLSDEIRLVQLLQSEPEQTPLRQIP
jgi:hypothetical protein